MPPNPPGRRPPVPPVIPPGATPRHNGARQILDPQGRAVRPEPPAAPTSTPTPAPTTPSTGIPPIGNFQIHPALLDAVKNAENRPAVFTARAAIHAQYREISAPDGMTEDGIIRLGELVDEYRTEIETAAAREITVDRLAKIDQLVGMANGAIVAAMIDFLLTGELPRHGGNLGPTIAAILTGTRGMNAAGFRHID